MPYSARWVSEVMASVACTRVRNATALCLCCLSLHLIYACSPPTISNTSMAGDGSRHRPLLPCLLPWCSVTVNSSSSSLQTLPFAASFLPPYLVATHLLIMEPEKRPRDVVWGLPFVKSKPDLVREEPTTDPSPDFSTSRVRSLVVIVSPMWPDCVFLNCSVFFLG